MKIVPCVRYAVVYYVHPADAKRAKRAAAKQAAVAPADMDDDAGGDDFDFDDANAADGLVGSGSEVSQLLSFQKFEFEHSNIGCLKLAGA